MPLYSRGPQDLKYQLRPGIDTVSSIARALEIISSITISTSLSVIVPFED